MQDFEQQLQKTQVAFQAQPLPSPQPDKQRFELVVEPDGTVRYVGELTPDAMEVLTHALDNSRQQSKQYGDRLLTSQRIAAWDSTWQNFVAIALVACLGFLISWSVGRAIGASLEPAFPHTTIRR